MRLLFIQETDWLKRNPLQHHHIAEMLSLRGHEIRVIDHELLWRAQKRRGLFSRRHVFQKVSKIYGGGHVTVIRPGIIKVPLLDYVSLILSHGGEIKRQIKEFRPDVIVGFGILNAYLAAGAARKNGIPFIYYWLDVLHWLIPLKPFQPLGKFIESRTLRLADAVVVVSESLREFVGKLGAHADRVHVLKPGISLKQFDPAINGEKVREQFGIKSDDTVLFFMGWLYHFSGLKEIALELARVKREKLKLFVVGEGDAFPDLLRIQREHRLQDTLILAGQRPYDEMPGFIAAADICLLAADPSEKVMHDGLPAKIFEYLAMGKPMISTRLPGVMGEFGEGNGVVYVVRPEDAVGKALELVNSGQVKKLGKKARKFVERYDWDSIVNQFEKILEEVTGVSIAGTGK